MSSYLSQVTTAPPMLPPRVVIHAKGGVGKTTFGSSAPHPILMPLEELSGLINQHIVQRCRERHTLFQPQFRFNVIQQWVQGFIPATLVNFHSALWYLPGSANAVILQGLITPAELRRPSLLDQRLATSFVIGHASGGPSPTLICRSSVDTLMRMQKSPCGRIASSAVIIASINLPFTSLMPSATALS